MAQILTAGLLIGAIYLGAPRPYRGTAPHLSTGRDTYPLADTEPVGAGQRLRKLYQLGSASLTRKGRAQAARAAMVELIGALAAELHTGAPAPLALTRAAESVDPRIIKHALAAAKFGGDIPAALRRDRIHNGITALDSLAALWQVAAESGAGMALAAERLAQAEAAAEKVRRELASQLAGPKASARVLAGLPILGMMLGAGLGGSPLGWLMGSPIGAVVLVAGTSLELAGLWWIHRLTHSVEQLL